MGTLGDDQFIGSALHSTNIDATYKFPYLGDLPLLGALFRSKQNNSDKRELIILVTPKVLDENSESLDSYGIKFNNQSSLNFLEQLNK